VHSARPKWQAAIYRSIGSVRLYDEGIARFARHIQNRTSAYAEAAPRFPGAPFWHEMTARRNRATA
jgi:hypothetical protein